MLAWQDRTGGYIYPMKREHGESKVDYTLRFFRDIRGLGMCNILTVNGKCTRTRKRAKRTY